MKWAPYLFTCALLFFLIQSCVNSTEPSPTLDLDNDGIPDALEASGKSYNGLSLYDLGARANQVDLFVHVFYMDNALDLGITPQKQALEKVRDAFAAKGIAVHFDVGNLFHTRTGLSPSDFDLSDVDHGIPFTRTIKFSSNDAHTTSVASLYNNNMPSSRKSIFYLMVFGSSQKANGTGDSSGIAQVNGHISIISLGNWNLRGNRAINVQAGTIMHELGHNLGLNHGGAPTNDVNQKPNYYSVMNYLYQINGLPQVGNRDYDRCFKNGLKIGNVSLLHDNDSHPSLFKIDFSDGAGRPLNEANFNEATGVLMRQGSSPADVNQNLSTDASVVIDINNDNYINVLRDHDDWGNLYFYFGEIYKNPNASHLGAGPFFENLEDLPLASSCMDYSDFFE